MKPGYISGCQLELVHTGVDLGIILPFWVSLAIFAICIVDSIFDY